MGEVRLMKQKKYKECNATISPHKNTINNIKKTPNAHHRSSKVSFIIQKMLLQILATIFTKREWEREKRVGEIWAA
jgi:hypothetical protein